MIKPRLDLTIGPRSNVAHLNCAPKFIEDLPYDLLSLFWIAGLAFVKHCQLLISFVAVPGIF